MSGRGELHVRWRNDFDGGEKVAAGDRVCEQIREMAKNSFVHVTVQY